MSYIPVENANFKEADIIGWIETCCERNRAQTTKKRTQNMVAYKHMYYFKILAQSCHVENIILYQFKAYMKATIDIYLYLQNSCS